MKLGSLFSGSGGWELAARMCGIEPVWASEIEPFPIKVTKKNFPNMKHLGDITKIHGDQIEPVDIITSGSPCFAVGTLISTVDGQKPIEEINIGDQVYTHTGMTRMVKEIFIRPYKQTYKIKFEGYEAVCTANHPFLIRHGRTLADKPEWIAAEDIKEGDYVASLLEKRTIYLNRTYSWHKFESITEDKMQAVYNLEVVKDHSYIANGMVVHNCQDLSIAGKREGIEGERSGLFMESIRIIKEMREKTHDEYPAFFVWENVPGTFSSGNGSDFCSVLNAIIGVKEPGYTIPRPNEWKDAGAIVGDGYSVAWRVLDSQYWGVPQRRRRIFLVADFNSGGGATEILFKRDGLQRNIEKSQREGQRTTSDIGTSVEKSRRGLKIVENHLKDLRLKICEDDICQTLSASMGTGGNNQPLCFDIRLTSEGTKNERANIYPTDTSRTLSTGNNSPDGNQGGVAIIENDIYTLSKASFQTTATKNGAVDTLVASDYKDPPIVFRERAYFDYEEDSICASQKSCGGSYGGGSENMAVNKKTIRRLTPLECCRLQGFPDDWCDGIPHSDSAEYKMWGNGMALPCALYVMEGIKEYADKREK